ncbi:hypothetical protein K493DRAFT_313602 [Basidiobolus meristosporus CBS 931.73]|uniref:Uncharacterized protein n=1 Tax=Basidiobolus meristosporus CBS 931.73 TaxID=1314790 RepID=A0A1Y1YKP1_9FUNG|nr:hypothetical protein K493DRAFT_313602 [Basidiobolus meristosporus CBS 931.73]|eukprot:ORX98591.1 hypothetical protein K493DRAFT_313602 [Basidiobolus meristosporus CBS 931.73]
MSLRTGLGFYFCLFLVLLSPFAAWAQEKPEVKVSADFSGVVVNGEMNNMVISFANNGETELSVATVQGAFVHPDNFEQVLRSLTPLKVNKKVAAGDIIEIPFKFYADFSPTELGLVVSVDFADKAKTTFNEVAHSAVVMLISTESIFDIQLLSVYLLLIAGVVGIGYMIKNTYFKPAPKKRAAPQPVAPVKDTEKKVDQSWVPEHHFKSSPKQSPKTSPKLKKRRA